MTLLPLSVLRCFVESRLAFCKPLTSVAEADADNGLGGRLLLLFGGAGKAPMLVVLRKVLPGVGRPVGGEVDVAEFKAELAGAPGSEAVLSVGTAGVVFALISRGVGRPDVVTDLLGVVVPGVGIPDAGELARDASSGISGSGLRAFAMGSAGRGPVGGGCGGRDDVLCGSAEAMVAVVTDIGFCTNAPARWPSAARAARRQRRKQLSLPPSLAPVTHVSWRRIGSGHRDARCSIPPCMCFPVSYFFSPVDVRVAVPLTSGEKSIPAAMGPIETGPRRRVVRSFACRLGTRMRSFG